MIRSSKWTEDSIVYALRAFQEREGRRAGANDVKGKVRDRGLPTHEAISRVFGSFSNATVVAYGEALPVGGAFMAKDDDTEAVIEALQRGDTTLTRLAAERGISGQALGRRLRRYQRAYGLPVVNRTAGAPGVRRRRN